jgi:type 2 lantibiotic biosynthesis protein LanM
MGSEQDKFLETAYGIGIKLSRNAIWSSNKCNWVGPSMEFMDNTWKVVQRSYGTDLYSGTAGIGYFLSFLYAQTNDNIIKKTALGCFEQCIANLEQTPQNARIGLYTGWAGVAEVLQVCGPLLAIPEFERKAASLLESLMLSDLKESGIDVLAGSAGAIPVYLSQVHGNDDRYIKFAKQIADHLIEIAHKTKKGWSWNTLNIHSKDSSADLTGFSHGTAGIAWALMELYYVTKEEKYNSAAQMAFEYERSWFDPQYGNWPDLRNKNENNNIASLYGSVAWCHGAPGIGLSRLRAYDLSGDEVYKKEAEIAISTTYNMINQSLQTGQSNFSLCHGIAGNAELLIMAGISLKNTELINYAQEVGRAGINLYANALNPWPCGIIGAGELPGLMLGIAGIGLFYLRLHDYLNIPSILILHPQVRSFGKSGSNANVQ